MISVKRKSMKPILDIKIPQMMTEDEAHGSGPGCPPEKALLHPHGTGVCGLDQAIHFFRDKRHLQKMGAAEDGLGLKGSRNGLMIVIPGAPAKEAASLFERAPARG
jgi:hypothetical protein